MPACLGAICIDKETLCNEAWSGVGWRGSGVRNGFDCAGAGAAGGEGGRGVDRSGEDSRACAVSFGRSARRPRAWVARQRAGGEVHCNRVRARWAGARRRQRDILSAGEVRWHQGEGGGDEFRVHSAAWCAAAADLWRRLHGDQSGAHAGCGRGRADRLCGLWRDGAGVRMGRLCERRREGQGDPVHRGRSAVGGSEVLWRRCSDVLRPLDV